MLEGLISKNLTALPPLDVEKSPAVKQGWCDIKRAQMTRQRFISRNSSIEKSYTRNICFRFSLVGSSYLRARAKNLRRSKAKGVFVR